MTLSEGIGEGSVEFKFTNTPGFLLWFVTSDCSLLESKHYSELHFGYRSCGLVHRSLAALARKIYGLYTIMYSMPYL